MSPNPPFGPLCAAAVPQFGLGDWVNIHVLADAAEAAVRGAGPLILKAIQLGVPAGSIFQILISSVGPVLLQKLQELIQYTTEGGAQGMVSMPEAPSMPENMKSGMYESKPPQDLQDLHRLVEEWYLKRRGEWAHGPTGAGVTG
jgi:hypothetical protein